MSEINVSTAKQGTLINIVVDIDNLLAKLDVSKVANIEREVTTAAAIYLIGNSRRGLKHYPRYRYITRRQAYGRTFFSDKQRRYVMAQIRSGKITPGYPRRTSSMQRAWRYKRVGSDTLVYNDVTHAKFSHGIRSQARLNKRAGWRTTKEIATSNKRGMLREAKKAAVRALQAEHNKK